MLSQTSALERLPYDIKQLILDEIESEKDLLNFALSSKNWCGLVVPNHLQYRSLRLDVDRPELWSHLAQKAGLASRIRTVVLGPNFPGPAIEGVDPTPFPPDIYPQVQNIGGGAAVNQRGSSPQDVQQAFANMTRLDTFQWMVRVRPWSLLSDQQLSPIHDTANAWHILQVSKCTSLITTGGSFIARNMDLKRKDHPFYHLRGLETLSLTTWQWADSSPEARHFVQLFQLNVHTLSMLELDVPFFPLEVMDVTFPNLKTVLLVSVPIEGHDDLAASARELKMLSFLSQNPSITHLIWASKMFGAEVPQGFLPNLESMHCHSMLLLPMLERGIASSVLTTIVGFPPTNQTFALLSQRQHELGSLKYITLHGYLDPALLIELGIILPDLEAVGLRGPDMWLGEADFIEFVSNFKALRVAHGFRVLFEGPDREGVARKIAKKAPSLVCARIRYPDDGSGSEKDNEPRVVHLPDGRWEVEKESVLPYALCSEEEFDIIQDYYHLESSDYPPEPDIQWEIPL
ncbi:hypothetical protein BKA70DRAFT_1316601 [Coprinopsis sp. MPI-PUGE-AT-0042]|nr:hypothetical protein BKA70DRAFT_1316601 [Coprinopsis sp. MPI-PUGE-AT-0042]